MRFLLVQNKSAHMEAILTDVFAQPEIRLPTMSHLGTTSEQRTKNARRMENDPQFLQDELASWKQINGLIRGHQTALAKIVQNATPLFGSAYVAAEENIRLYKPVVHNIIISSVQQNIQNIVENPQLRAEDVGAQHLYELICVVYGERIMSASAVLRQLEEMQQEMTIMHIADYEMTESQNPYVVLREEKNYLADRLRYECSLIPAVCIGNMYVQHGIMSRGLKELQSYMVAYRRLQNQSAQEVDNLQSERMLERARRLHELSTERTLVLGAGAGLAAANANMSIPLPNLVRDNVERIIQQVVHRYKPEDSTITVDTPAWKNMCRGSIINNCNLVYVHVYEAKLVEIYTVTRAESNAIGSVWLTNVAANLNTADVEEELRGVPYVSFKSSDSLLYEQEACLPLEPCTAAPNSSEPWRNVPMGELGFVPKEKKSRTALAGRIAKPILMLSQLQRTNIGSNMRGYAVARGCSGKEEEIVRMAFSSWKEQCGSGSKILEGKNKVQQSMPTVSFITAVAGIAMWYPSQIGKSLNWNTFSHTKRESDVPLVVANILPENIVGDRGHAKPPSKVTVYANNNSMMWSYTAMLG